jgi:hypothetical protein
MLVLGITALCLVPGDMKGRIIVGGGDGTIELLEELEAVTAPEPSPLCKVKMLSLPQLLAVSKMEFSTNTVNFCLSVCRLPTHNFCYSN